MAFETRIDRRTAASALLSMVALVGSAPVRAGSANTAGGAAEDAPQPMVPRQIASLRHTKCSNSNQNANLNHRTALAGVQHIGLLSFASLPATLRLIYIMPFNGRSEIVTGGMYVLHHRHEMHDLLLTPKFNMYTL
jgi:hypothetical protein